MERQFIVDDLWLASYLSFRGVSPELENRNGRVVFLFPQSDTLYRLISAFNSNDAIPLSEYIGTYKALKVKMFGIRAAR